MGKITVKNCWSINCGSGIHISGGPDDEVVIEGGGFVNTPNPICIEGCRTDIKNVLVGHSDASISRKQHVDFSFSTPSETAFTVCIKDLVVRVGVTAGLVKLDRLVSPSQSVTRETVPRRARRQRS